MSSLNAYADSIDEDGRPIDVDIPTLFGENVVPGEVPATEPEIILFSEATAAMEDMTAILNSLYQVGGMSRQIAMEARDVYPEFDQRKPINAYTETPTATRYKLAQESLIEGIRNLVDKAILALKKIIRNLIVWFSGTAASEKRTAEEIEHDIGEKTEARLKGIDKAEESAEELFSNTAMINDKIRAGLSFKFPNGEVKTFDSLEALIKAAYAKTQAEPEIEKFLLNFDPIYYDMLFGGDYTKACSELSNVIARAQGILGSKIQLLKNIIGKASKNSELFEQYLDMHSLKVVREPLLMNFQGRQQLMRDIARDVANKRIMAKEVEITEAPSLAAVFERFSLLYKQGPIRRMVRDYEVATVMMVNLEEMINQLHAISSDVLVEDSVKNGRHLVNEKIREILPLIQNDLASISATMTEIDIFRRDMESINRTAHTFALLVAKRLRNMIVQTGGDERASMLLKALNGWGTQHVHNKVSTWQETFTSNFSVNGAR